MVVSIYTVGFIDFDPGHDATLHRVCLHTRVLPMAQESLFTRHRLNDLVDLSFSDLRRRRPTRRGRATSWRISFLSPPDAVNGDSMRAAPSVPYVIDNGLRRAETSRDVRLRMPAFRQ